jgi:DNA-binding Lrp family transcriptional regulator
MANPIKAYLLIETQTGESNTVLESLKKLDQTVQVDRVTGPYDIICVIETDSLDNIGNIVRDSIHTMPGVTRTMSCMQIGI